MRDDVYDVGDLGHDDGVPYLGKTAPRAIRDKRWAADGDALPKGLCARGGWDRLLQTKPESRRLGAPGRGKPTPCGLYKVEPPEPDHRMPTYPTAAVPGTEAKLGVMVRRVDRGERCFHPKDAKMDAFGVARVMPCPPDVAPPDRFPPRMGGPRRNNTQNATTDWLAVDERAYRAEHESHETFWDDDDDEE